MTNTFSKTIEEKKILVEGWIFAIPAIFGYISFHKPIYFTSVKQERYSKKYRPQINRKANTTST